MSTIAGTPTTRTSAQPLFVACHMTPFLDQEEKEHTPLIHVKSPLISDDEENDVIASDVEEEASSSDNDDMYLSEANRCSLSDNIVISDVTSVRTIDNDSLSDAGSNDTLARIGPSVNAVRTVLVPVRDPLTRELRNVLVPVEMKDETGMNIIKSVLIPVEDEDGLMSYEIKKVVVPIKRELRLLQETPKPLPSKGTPKPVNDKKTEDKKSGEKEVERKKEVKENVEEKKEESTVNEQAKEEEEPVPETEKEEVDVILENVKNTCPYCQKLFANEIQVDRHIRKNHRKKPFRCHLCDYSSTTQESHEDHMKTHGNNTHLECPFCHQKYKRITGLRYHQIRVHSTIEPQFTCDDCGRRYKIKRDLASHIERNHVMDTYVCRYCGKNVRNIKQHEWHHERATIKVELPLSCHICPAKFKRQTGLDNHLLMHKNSIKCDQCSKAFITKCELEDHKANHTEAKTFLCRICHNAYSQVSCLMAHKLLAHGIKHRVPKEFQCNICSRSYATEDSLRKHVALHSRSFACSHCGKEFTNSNYLKLHNRKHTGERPYECKICRKSFARSNALRVHRLTHTGERPYVCDLCGQSFTQRSTMMAHRRKHPGSHPPPPPLRLSKLKINENEF